MKIGERSLLKKSTAGNAEFKERIGQWPYEELSLDAETLPITAGDYPALSKAILESAHRRYQSEIMTGVINYFNQEEAEEAWGDYQRMQPQIVSALEGFAWGELPDGSEAWYKVQSKLEQKFRDRLKAEKQEVELSEAENQGVEEYANLLISRREAQRIPPQLRKEMEESYPLVLEEESDGEPVDWDDFELVHQLQDRLQERIEIELPFADSDFYPEVSLEVTKEVQRLADAAVHMLDYAVENQTNKVVFLDKSARYLGHLFRKLWQVAYPDSASPEVLFLNIGLETDDSNQAEAEGQLDEELKIIERIVHPQPEDVILVVDDLIASGHSLLSTLERLRLATEGKNVRLLATVPFDRDPCWYGLREFSILLDDDESEFKQGLEGNDLLRLEEVPISVRSSGLPQYVARHEGQLSKEGYAQMRELRDQRVGNAQRLRQDLNQIADLVNVHAQRVRVGKVQTPAQLEFDEDSSVIEQKVRDLLS